VDDEPVLPPGPDADDGGGCEDPTVVGDERGCAVFYSGWNPETEEGRLLWRGPTATWLRCHESQLASRVPKGSGCGVQGPSRLGVVTGYLVATLVFPERF
jgi:hypothetical protein